MSEADQRMFIDLFRRISASHSADEITSEGVLRRLAEEAYDALK